MNRKQLVIALALVSPVLVTIGCGGMNETRSVTEQQPVPVYSEPSITDSRDSQPVEADLDEAVYAEVLEEPALPVQAETETVESPLSPPDTLAFYFASNESAVDQADFETLIAHARYLIQNPGMVLRLSGHTDQSGSRDYNQWLAKQRAEAVAEILIEYGVQPTQIRIESLGEDQPIAGLEHAIADRRVELEYSNEARLTEANGF